MDKYIIITFSLQRHLGLLKDLFHSSWLLYAS